MTQRTSDKQSLDRLVGNYGSFIFGTGTITPPAGIDISAIVAGEDGCVITTIRLEKEGVEYKYADSDETYTNDGITLGAGELLEMPFNCRLKSIVVASGGFKGILSKEIALKEV